ncbi:glycosyltransferase [Aeromicrobium sp. UC242_57]|uniref:glycosyltransferase n=1 Tax=Aeromicrobium sp. UC242_57 TaxID=3374624 RepID=UPI00378BF233
MDTPPFRIVVVDNASTDDTQDVIAKATALFPEGVLVNHRLDTNTGGSGGFSEGTKVALEHGADWVWLMDDDVEILPDAIEQFAPWMQRFKGHPRTPLRLRRLTVLLAGQVQRVPRRAPALQRQAVRPRGLCGHQLRDVRGNADQRRHRAHDRPARSPLLHLVGRCRLCLARRPSTPTSSTSTHSS